jgi:hypothetical protein
MAKSGIHIKESHKGLLHKQMGIPVGKKIPASKLAAKKAKDKKSGNVAAFKRDVFAENAKHFKHKGGKRSK